MDETRTPAGETRPAPETGQATALPFNRPNYLWAALVFGGVLVSLAYAIEPLTTLLAAYLVVACLILAGLPVKYRGRGLTVIIIVGILITLILPNFAPRGKPASACTKSNLHAIQLAVERYNVDHLEYPASIDALLAAKQNYLDTLPTNEYKADAGEGKQPMVELSKVYGGSHHDIAGDFAYLPRFEKLDGKLFVSGYTLIAFGKPTNLFEHSKIVHVLGLSRSLL